MKTFWITSEYVLVESKDAFCDLTKQLFGTPNSHFVSDNFRFFLRQAPLDGSIQKLVPINLGPNVL